MGRHHPKTGRVKRPERAYRLTAPCRVGTCKTGKARYLTKDAALFAAGNSALRYGHGMRTYRCPDCSGWHNTSRTKANRGRVERPSDQSRGKGQVQEPGDLSGLVGVLGSGDGVRPREAPTMLPGADVLGSRGQGEEVGQGGSGNLLGPESSDRHALGESPALASTDAQNTVKSNVASDPAEPSHEANPSDWWWNPA